VLALPTVVGDEDKGKVEVEVEVSSDMVEC
jgi:hypothetical protein